MNEIHTETDSSSIREDDDLIPEETIADNGKESDAEEVRGPQDLDFDYVDLLSLKHI